MIFPTIHLNGTSKNDLLDQYCDVGHALNAAIEKMCQNGPNGRDYYPQGSMAFETARAEHTARMQKLIEVRAEVNAIAEHIADA